MRLMGLTGSFDQKNTTCQTFNWKWFGGFFVHKNEPIDVESHIYKVTKMEWGGMESWYFPVYCLFCLKKSAVSWNPDWKTNPDILHQIAKSRNPDWILFPL
jgi:hypothetical protein